MINKCPYCKKEDCVREIAFTSAEMYGGNTFTINCKHCKKIISVHISRITKLDWVEKTDRTETDWPQSFQ
jgi:hypothetical protein